MKPNFEWDKTQAEWEFPIRIPLVEGDFRGKSTLAMANICSSVSNAAIGANEFIAVPFDRSQIVEWCGDFEPLYSRFDVDGQTLIAIRKATDEDYKRLRVPTFIQSNEWPMCCGRSMQFVGQIDDNDICTEPPPDAVFWWHDAASFYVYTCSICLECKAIGQQF